MTSDEDVFEINPQDFNSAVLVIDFVNNTTTTKTRNEGVIQIIEILDKGFLLELPSKSCSSGHNISLRIEAILPNKEKLIFETTAKVDEHKPLEDHVDQVKVTFMQYNEEQWKKFTAIFSNRQKQIEDFFTAAKGY